MQPIPGQSHNQVWENLSPKATGRLMPILIIVAPSLTNLIEVIT